MKNKTINLLVIQKAYIQEQKRIAEKVKGGVLVEEIPISCAGYYKDDRHYITVDALNINPNSVLNSIFR